jgi:DNA-binding Xre family transcriptional regulator
MTIADQLRQAIKRARPQTRYAIAKAAGIDQSVLTRFMQGDDIRLSTAGKLCKHLGLRLTE